MNIKTIAPTAARVLLGAAFVFFGLNGFLQFLPQPPMPERAASFGGALAATGYMFPLIKGFEVVSGALLLANRAVPLALLFLAPILVNILGFHLVLEAGAGLALPVILVALELYLAWTLRHVWGPIFSARVTGAPVAQRAHVDAHAE